MARPEKYDEDQILDTALKLLMESGARGVSVAGVVRELGAPSGSVYHRFASRDVLLATMWLRTVERFQRGYLEVLDQPDVRQALAQATRWVVRWCREHPAEGRLLMLPRREDLMDGDWPESVSRRARAVAEQLNSGMQRFATRLWPDGQGDRALLRFAAISIPQAAVMPYLRGVEQVPVGLEQAVERAVLAALEMEPYTAEISPR